MLRPELSLYAVADGAGGPGVGNVASSMGLAAVAAYLEETQRDAERAPPIDAFGLYRNARRLAIAVQRANQAIITLAKSSKKLRELASTVVAVLVDPALGLLHVCHLGDSRCYRFRAGLVEPLTIDHSLLHDVLELRPETDDAALAKLPREVVTRALGMPQVRAEIRSFEMLPGDKYLLCSDGVSSALNHQQLAEVLGANRPPAELVNDVLTLATFPAPEDNATALVVSVALTPGTSLADRPRPPSTPRPISDPSEPEILLRTDVNPGTERLPLPSGASAPPSNSPEAMASSGRDFDGLLNTLVSGGEPPSSARSCASCRKTISDVARFCPHCGDRQPG